MHDRRYPGTRLTVCGTSCSHVSSPANGCLTNFGVPRLRLLQVHVVQGQEADLPVLAVAAERGLEPSAVQIAHEDSVRRPLKQELVAGQLVKRLWLYIPSAF